MTIKNYRSSRCKSRKSGFTLIQLMAVIAIMAVMATVLMSVFGRTRLGAKRAQCDTRIKAITMALDAFRQENGRFPSSLQELVDKKYLTDASMLRCPNDPRPTGSYNDFYVIRAGRDSDELPILVCPLCEGDGAQGIQAFKGRYTKQFAARPAEVTAASGAMVERPGKSAIAAKVGMLVRGGDKITTVSGGSATLKFADGSESEIRSSSEIRVLESFIAGQSRAPLYTMIRQVSGDVIYRVTHGSKFDVTTPTATAGALGTAYQIQSDTNGDWWLKVLDSKVYCSDAYSSDVYTPANGTLNINNADGTISTNDWVYIGTTSSNSGTGYSSSASGRGAKQRGSTNNL